MAPLRSYPRNGRDRDGLAIVFGTQRANSYSLSRETVRHVLVIPGAFHVDPVHLQTRLLRPMSARTNRPPTIGLALARNHVRRRPAGFSSRNRAPPHLPSTTTRGFRFLRAHVVLLAPPWGNERLTAWTRTKFHAAGTRKVLPGTLALYTSLEKPVSFISFRAGALTRELRCVFHLPQRADSVNIDRQGCTAILWRERGRRLLRQAPRSATET